MNPAERINIVLVRPIYPRNIGMCARAMANMGVARLVLIAPQCGLSEDAKQGATKAQRILREAVTYSSLESFHESEGEGIRIALSGRAGQLRAPDRLDLKLESLAQMSTPRILAPEVPIYLFFGPEDHGLSDDDIRLVHHICALPTFGDFFSMNLSHATMLTLYVVRTFLREKGVDDSKPAPLMRGGKSSEPKGEGELMKERLRAMHAPKYFPEQTIDRWLEALGFEIDQRRMNAGRVLKRILLENEPTQDELRIFEAIVQQTIRKLKS